MSEGTGRTHYVLHPSPVALLRLGSSGGALTHLWFVTPDSVVPDGWERGDPDGLLAEATRQLDAYFARTLVRFDLPLAPSGTPFQQKVWAALREIPLGRTVTYAELATQTGSGSRAVGGANGANPVGIVIPCHRVVNTDGGLGGYAGGIDQKRWLLRHEGALQPALFG